ncbi:hypothetical protein ACFWAR_15235 [Streptomyces sp. NPDC059917]|uniref:hypothetical protein n=1 Tax=Streptomyces sp. NPDC059917 TaxID=3347002 RepID=UPI00364766AB
MVTIDHDAVLRARMLLLGSGRPSARDQVDAYRVLVEVNPKAYAPKLVDALLSLRYQSKSPERDVELTAEASRVARGIEVGEPKRAERLLRALDAHRFSLLAVGRRTEGRAVCEELAAAGLSTPLTIALAEEGDFARAAELDEAAARNEDSDNVFWNRVQWAANLEGAGRHDAASTVFREVLEETRRKAAEQLTSLSKLTWESVHYSRMRDAVGDGAGAAAARREALGVLAELASTGEPKGWGRALGWWRTLFVLSGRAAEPAASPESPMPPYGAEYGWSRDVREGFLGMRAGLEREAEALRAAHRLPELVDVQRRISVRVAVRQGDHHYLFEERLTPYFDEGVALSRRVPDDRARLARALVDRSMFLVAACAFEPAHADFAEAVALLER